MYSEMALSLTMSSSSGSWICCILNCRSKFTVSSIWSMLRGAPFFLVMVLRVRRVNSTMTSMSVSVRSVNSVSSGFVGSTSFPSIFFIFSNMGVSCCRLFLLGVLVGCL